MCHINQVRLQRCRVPVMAPREDDASAQDLAGGFDLGQHARLALELE